jgi:competence protein ComEA
MDDRRKLEIAAWAVGGVVVVLLAFHFMGGRSGGAAPVAVSGPGTGAPPARPAVSRSAGRPMVVDVEGEVQRPGVQRVPAGSRAESAVRQAGGLTRRGDATAVNLAAPLHDGQQVVVPRRGTHVAAAAGGAAASGAAGAGAAGAPGAAGAAPAQPVSLSTATVAQLDGLDGIGPTLAGRIIAYRQAHGGFRSVDELKQVEGIGEKRFASLKASVAP